MRRNILLAGFALAVVIPSAAAAQETCEQRAQNRVAGTAIGAVAGALIGSSVAGHHDRATGAVVGGVAGAVIGNQVAKGPADCRHAYGWYDDRGGWHANAVDPNLAWGYYDRRGAWVEGRPADYRPAEYRAPPPRGDWDDDRAWGDRPGSPDLRAYEDRIHEEIRHGVRDGRIDRGEARDLMGRLRDIRADEARIFEARGDRLPPDARYRLRERLRDLDREVGRAARYR